MCVQVKAAKTLWLAYRPGKIVLVTHIKCELICEGFSFFLKVFAVAK